MRGLCVAGAASHKGRQAKKMFRSLSQLGACARLALRVPAGGFRGAERAWGKERARARSGVGALGRGQPRGQPEAATGHLLFFSQHALAHKHTHVHALAAAGAAETSTSLAACVQEAQKRLLHFG